MDEQWDPNSVRDLVIAIVEQGVEDVMKGDPSAIAWLDSRGFEHWCAWLNIDPTAARESIQQRRREGGNIKYNEADLRRAYELHKRGVSWRNVMFDVFGYYSETLRTLLFRYNQQRNQSAAPEAG